MRNAARGATLFLLFVVAVYFCAAVPWHGATKPRFRVSYLQYGQAVALSDLDGDNKIDQATLGGSGSDKTIDVFLSRSVKPSILHFSTRSTWHGSLLARDIDNDGDIDLVWTDTVNPDDVVVWVNDGVGRFQQAASYGWSGRFVIGGDDIGGSSATSRVASAGPGRFPDVDLRAEAISEFSEPNGLHRAADGSTPGATGVFFLPTGRAPPCLS